MYNQTVEQPNFTDYYNQSDWESDCNACANEVHNVNEPIPHDCYMCAEFSAKTITYNYLDLITLLFVPIITFVVIGFLVKKKKR